MNKPVILCVDDDKNILDSLKSQLQHQFAKQHEIEIAQSGEEALELCDELLAMGTDIPLVIVDYVMPGMYGDELLVELKKKLPHSLSIMLTGQATAEAVGSAVNKAGLFRYISKPWVESDFLLTVQTALDSYFQQIKIERQQQFNNTLSNVVALAIQPDPLQQQLERALNILIAIPDLQQASAAIYLLNESSQQLERQYQACSDESLYPEQLPADQHDRNDDQEPGQHHQELPIYYQDRLLGAIHLNPKKDTQLNEELMELLYSFSDALAGIISIRTYQNKLEQQNEELESIVEKRTKDLQDALKSQADLNDILLDANSKLDFYASMDGLTSLYNRRFFMKLANAELERARRYSHSTAFIMMDLDHFKSINDKYGHQAGDYVLEQVAVILKSECREVDLVGRLGGEEFAIVSPESKLEQAKQLAERIRHTINNTAIRFKGHDIVVTASIGITEILKEDIQIDTAMTRADYALYQSKGTGRNQVSIVN